MNRNSATIENVLTRREHLWEKQYDNKREKAKVVRYVKGKNKDKNEQER